MLVRRAGTLLDFHRQLGEVGRERRGGNFCVWDRCGLLSQKIRLTSVGEINLADYERPELDLDSPFQKIPVSLKSQSLIQNNTLKLQAERLRQHQTASTSTDQEKLPVKSFPVAISPVMNSLGEFRRLYQTKSPLFPCI